MSPRVVALGGGHGLYATLSAARRLTPHVTAIVTVADDGGSSGRLRSELDVVPPGDLRMALAALASASSTEYTLAPGAERAMRNAPYPQYVPSSSASFGSARRTAASSSTPFSSPTLINIDFS